MVRNFGTAEPIPARGLLKVQADLGPEERTLLAAFYKLEQHVEVKVVVAAKPEPAAIRGILSENMMLCAGCSDRQDIALLTTNKHMTYGTPLEQFLFD